MAIWREDWENRDPKAGAKSVDRVARNSLIAHYSSLITHHSLLITHYSSLITHHCIPYHELLDLPDAAQ
jgi:hypothetical protein